MTLSCCGVITKGVIFIDKVQKLFIPNAKIVSMMQVYKDGFAKSVMRYA